MTELNLIAEDKSQERILNYLQDNVSDTLADKINNGVIVEKDGKRLMSKKSLDGFMDYANKEANKLAEKKKNYACIDDDTVYGWAIHYFEEDSIEGTLYNEDCTEYKPVVKASPKLTSKTGKSNQPSNGQTSLFDLIDAPTDNENNKQQIAEVSDILNDLNPKIQERKEIPKFYSQYLETQKQYPQDIVINRLGDFYEAFGESAVTLSKELDLTLTGRNVGLEERLPMVVFPYHAKDVYLNKILKLHNVVIIENEQIQRLTQTVQADDESAIDLETGEVLDCKESEPYIDVLSRLLDNKIKIVR